MGISCEINMCKPTDGAFQSGELVNGKIKYKIDKPMAVEKIIVSLKGSGHLRIIKSIRDKNGKRNSYRNSEIYVDIDNVSHEGKTEIPAGSYEIDVNFRLPHNIPPTFEYYNSVPGYRVNCRIKYYVRIRFDRPGWLAFSKRFNKEIIVTSPIIPKLRREPVIYGDKKTLTRLFTTKPNVITIKATIANSVIPIGGKINVDYQIENATNKSIKSVETKLLEMYTFKASIKEIKTYEDVSDKETKTGSVKSGETQVMSIEFDVPSDKVSLDHSEMVVKNFVVRITVILPKPHRNMVLEIPVQVGDIEVRDEIDTPPSYWESMGEDDKKADALSDEDEEKS